MNSPPTLKRQKTDHHLMSVIIPTMSSQREEYLTHLLNHEFPVARLKDLDCPAVESRIRHLIHTTNEDGSHRNGGDPPDSVHPPTPDTMHTIPFDLNPYKDYGVTSTESCPHCRLPSAQCVETLFGLQLRHYFMRAVLSKGAIYYLEDVDDENATIQSNFRKLLSQLKFAAAITNGTPLPHYSEEGMKLVNNPQLVEPPLPLCIIDGSYNKFLNWFSQQQCVWEWGYDICPCTAENDVEYPMAVVNFYRGTE